MRFQPSAGSLATTPGRERACGARSRPPLLIAGVLATAALLATGCGSSSKTTSSTEANSTPAASSTPAATSTPATTTSTSASGLSGTWNGSYSGAYSGTFVLKWTQTGSNLAGRIAISAPAATLGVHGTLNGSMIEFGTVGSVAITYTGSVSGNSMSGSFQTPGGGGSWNASKK